MSEGEKKRERSRSREKDRGRRRSRSRSRGRRRSRSRDRKSDRSRDRHSRSRSGRRSRRSRSKDRRRSRSPRRRETSEERAEKMKRKKMEELTRDVRTVFVGQLQVRATEKDIKRFFKKVAKVKVNDVQLITDKRSGRSKGFAYVELRSLEDVPKALALNGQPFQWKKGKVGFPVLVKPSNAEKNYQWNMNKKQEEADMRTLTISNLQIGVSEQNLRTLLEPFGGVEHIEMTKDTHGVPIGQCLVRFVSVSFAEKVVENLNGVELGGRPMEVMRLFDPIEAKKNKVVPSLMNTTSFLNNGGDSNVVTNPESTSWRLDAGRSGGLNAQSRSALMAKLAEKTGSNLTPLGVRPPTTTSSVVTPMSEDPIGDPSTCMVVKNMFDPKEEQGDSWDKEIEEDVVDEVTKFGKVKHCFVDKTSLGFVYLMFESKSAGEACGRELHGRFFNRKKLSVQFFPQGAYTAKFKLM